MKTVLSNPLFKDQQALKFSILRSGSSGNCTFIEHQNTRVLLDAGLSSRKKIVESLQEIGVEPESIDAVVCTHLHGDHLGRSTLSFCGTFQTSLWIHHQNEIPFCSRYPAKFRANVDLHTFLDDSFSIGGIRFEPFEVAHDAVGVTHGFRFYSADEPDRVVGYAADLGSACETVVGGFRDVSIICIESNHDPELLWKNPLRTTEHKKRVTGGRGHISNVQCAEAIVASMKASSVKPSTVILCHLSEDHNTPELARTTVRNILTEHGLSPELVVASRNERTVFFEFPVSDLWSVGEVVH